MRSGLANVSIPFRADTVFELFPYKTPNGKIELFQSLSGLTLCLNTYRKGMLPILMGTFQSLSGLTLCLNIVADGKPFLPKKMFQSLSGLTLCLNEEIGSSKKYLFQSFNPFQG